MEDPIDYIVRDKIAKHINWPVELIEASQTLRRHLGLFPLNLVLIALELEDELHVRLLPEGLGALKTVADFQSFVRSSREHSTGESGFNTTAKDKRPQNLGKMTWGMALF